MLSVVECVAASHWRPTDRRDTVHCCR